MESRKKMAAAKKACGSHNCAQALCCTYHDFTGLDVDTIKHAGSSFAVGMGNMEGTCGALIGAGIVYGLATKDKVKAMKGMRQMMDKFQKRYLQPIITQYFIDNKSEIWLLFLIAHSKR